jgi:protein gp37
MTNQTAIEWTDHTWNPVSGCSKVSQGCKYCYAERVFPRPYPGRKFTDVRTHPDRLLQPMSLKAGRRIFVNSMSDLFHESVPFSFIAAVFAVMAVTPRHTFQVLTKRPEIAGGFFNWIGGNSQAVMHEAIKGAIGYDNPRRPAVNVTTWPLPNVWVGVSVEDQTTANERVSLLLELPAAIRFLSCEPLLGAIDLTHIPRKPNDYDRAMPGFADCTGFYMDALDGSQSIKTRTHEYVGEPSPAKVDWLIAGGESGPRARLMDIRWARGLRDQCLIAGVPFLFKQWGEWAPLIDHDHTEIAGKPYEILVDGYTAVKLGKKVSGRMLDGRTWDQFPGVA